MSAAEDDGYRQELSRAMSTRDLVVYGMVFMVPISPFGVFGFIWNDARGMVPLAYLIGLTGMYFTAMSYAVMSRAYPMAGSLYAYVGRGLHPTAGFYAGWLILLDYILSPALLYVFSIVALRPLLPAVPDWMWLLTFVSFNAWVNVRGVRLSARVNLGMLALELLILAIFMAVGLLALYGGQGAGALTLRPLFDPETFSLRTLATATSLAVLSFLGFDGISTLAEESTGGRDSVGRATLLALSLVGLLFVAQSWIAADLSLGIRFSAPDSAFYELAARIGGNALRLAVLLIVVLASAIANAMAAQAAVARVLYAMARDGRLPAPLARIHPRFRTPHVSTLCVAVVSLVVGLLFASHVDELSRIVNCGALSGFLLLHVAVINHFIRRQRSRAWVPHLLVPLCGFLVIAYVLYGMDRASKTVAALWVAVGIVYSVLLARHRRTALQPGEL